MPQRSRISDPFEHLTEDHRILADLLAILARVSRLGARNTQEKDFAQFRDRLKLHADLEEAVVYPALERPVETRDKALESYAEHHVIRLTLEEMSLLQPGSEEWLLKLALLTDNLLRHFEEEEQNLFPSARNALGQNRVHVMRTSMEEYLGR
ncbi:MAG: hemerythrin domain-containing protein [Patescibacteria group bacterium]